MQLIEASRPAEAARAPWARLEVAIVDDDEAARRSTAWLLEGEGYRTLSFASGDAFLAVRPPADLTCVLLDMEMPGRTGLDVLHALSEREASPPVIVVTGHAHIDMAVEAMKLGAVDFIQKPYRPTRLLRALRCGTAPREPSRPRRPAESEAGALVNGLTKRQKQILAGIVRGRPNKIIAWELQLSIRTVEFHRAELFRRLRVGSTAEAVGIALAAGFDNRGASVAE